MTLATDIAADYTHFDGVEDITFTPQNPVAAAQASVKALRRVLTRRDLMGIGVEPTDLVFNLWVTTLGGKVPKNGDKITDASLVSYLIQSCELGTMATRWRCICRKTA